MELGHRNRVYPSTPGLTCSHLRAQENNKAHDTQWNMAGSTQMTFVSSIKQSAYANEDNMASD